MNYNRIFILLPLLFLFSLISYSQDLSSANLNLSLFNGGNFKVVLDDTEFSDYTDEMQFDNLISGKHYLKVTREPDGTNKSPEIIFSDYIEVPSGHIIYAVIDEYGKYYIYKKYNRRYFEKKHHQANECNCNCEYCRNCRYKNNRQHEEILIKDDCSYKVMLESDFILLKTTAAYRSFESSKLEVLKQAIDANYFLTDQVKELLSLLDFETSKLEIAKYAYDKTCDKKNYFRINDVFGFESSISELESYIKEKNK